MTAHTEDKTMMKQFDLLVASAGLEYMMNFKRLAMGEVFYLYYSAGRPGVSGEFRMVSDSDSDRAPDGFQLADPRAIRGDRDAAQYRQWVRSVGFYLPILPILA